MNAQPARLANLTLFSCFAFCFIAQNSNLLSTTTHDYIQLIYITMVLLENDAFLTELTKLFVKTREKGSVFLTYKKCKVKSLKELVLNGII
jgi:hypothetical protein